MADKDRVPAVPDAIDSGIDTCPKVCGGKKFVAPFLTDKKESDMEDIVIDGLARKRPATIRYLCPFRRHLEVGKTYRWCACGKSADVLCDDSCGPSDLAPLEFSLAKPVSWNSLCACRYTSSPPFCDGQHYEPEVGQDEYADEVGVPAPSACSNWPEQKAAFAAAKKASRPGAAPAPAEVMTVQKPIGCTGACARARKAKEAGIIEIEDLGKDAAADAGR